MNNISNENPWLIQVKNILNETGLSYIWQSQTPPCISWLKLHISNVYKDQYLQKWSSIVNTSSKCINYKYFKCNFKMEDYLLTLPNKLRIPLTKFRLRNHNLPIEKGVHKNIPRPQKLCKLCNDEEVGDEFHYLLKCNYFVDIRPKFLPTCVQVHIATTN